MPETSETLIEALRERCLAGGIQGIKGLSVVFRSMDIDYSKRIVLEELKDALDRYGIRMSDGYLQTLFNAFDTNNSGGIDFCEFMHKLRPPMRPCRMSVINQAFDVLDVNNDNAICMEDLGGKCLTFD